jgi:hypothetical protein
MLIGVCLTVFNACKKAVSKASFIKNYGVTSFTTDTVTGVGAKFLGEQVVKTDLTKDLADQGFTLANIKSVKILNVVLNVVDPSRNLNCFRKLDIRVSNSTGAGDVAITSVNLPDETSAKFVYFKTADIDMHEFFKNDELTFKFYGINDLPIRPEPLKMEVRMLFEVNAALGN